MKTTRKHYLRMSTAGTEYEIIQSRTDENKFSVHKLGDLDIGAKRKYTVYAYGYDRNEFECNCPAGEHDRRCKHIEFVKEMIKLFHLNDPEVTKVSEPDTKKIPDVLAKKYISSDGPTKLKMEHIFNEYDFSCLTPKLKINQNDYELINTSSDCIKLVALRLKNNPSAHICAITEKGTLMLFKGIDPNIGLILDADGRIVIEKKKL